MARLHHLGTQGGGGTQMWGQLALLPLAQQSHLILAGDDCAILSFFSNLLCTWSKLTILRPHLMKQINLENGYPVSPAARASCDGPLMLPLAAPLSLLGGQLWSLRGLLGLLTSGLGPVRSQELRLLPSL